MLTHQDYTMERLLLNIHHIPHTHTHTRTHTHTHTHMQPLLHHPGFPLYFGSEIQGLFKDAEVAFSRTNY